MLYEGLIRGTDRKEFLRLVDAITLRLGYQPDWLMMVMKNESGFDPAIQHKDTLATGLIQFMPATARELGTTIDRLKLMPRVEQMEFVKKYYQLWIARGKRAHNATDLSLITFYPYAVGKPDDYVFGSERSDPDYAKRLAKANIGLDFNRDGGVTVAEYKAWLRKKLPPNLNDEYVRKLLDGGGK